MARYDASREKACTASLPQALAPYDSATRGIYVHPNSEHLASLAECFLSSAATAADPAVRPASEIKVGLSGDTTVRSKAAGVTRWGKMQIIESRETEAWMLVIVVYIGHTYLYSRSEELV